MSNLKKVHVLALGLNNVGSVVNALKDCGFSPIIVGLDHEAALVDCDLLVLPGTGNFGEASRRLSSSGMSAKVREFAGLGKPILGICLGMQLLFEESAEAPGEGGLGILKGKCIPLSKDKTRKFNIGWNATNAANGHEGILERNPSDFYYVHSYKCVPTLSEQIALTSTFEGEEYAAGVIAGNVVGVQFHPEKSSTAGRIFLKRVIGGLPNG